MYFSFSQDLMYFVGAVVLIWVSGFLCWALYEIARFFRQSNAIVEDTRETSGRLNELVRDVINKASGVMRLADVIAGLGKSLAGFLPRSDEDEDEGPRKSSRRKKKIRMSEVP